MQNQTATTKDISSSGCVSNIVKFVRTAVKKFLDPQVQKPIPAAIVVSENTKLTGGGVSPTTSTGNSAEVIFEVPSDEEKKLASLYPPFANVVRQVLAEARRRKMPVGIFCGYRSMEEQAALYLKGRDDTGRVVDRSQVVTNAPAGFSYHNFGLAADFSFDGNITKPGWQWSWDARFPWKELADISVSFGLEAAYYWRQFPEGPHVQMTYGFKPQQLLSLYNEDGLPAVYKALDNARTNA